MQWMTVWHGRMHSFCIYMYITYLYVCMCACAVSLRVSVCLSVWHLVYVMGFQSQPSDGLMSSLTCPSWSDVCIMLTEVAELFHRHDIAIETSCGKLSCSEAIPSLSKGVLFWVGKRASGRAGVCGCHCGCGFNYGWVVVEVLHGCLRACARVESG